MTYGPKESRNWPALLGYAAVAIVAYLVLSGAWDFLEHAKAVMK